MAADIAEPPLVVILGPTASGKTDVAIEVAREIGGEIICADSRTVYRGLDIGTAKPTLEDRALVPHHLLDVVSPNETYSAARFQRDARALITDIRRRGNVPMLVGGSGLYIDGLLFNYHFADPADPKQRAELEEKTLEDLFQYSTEHNIKLPNNLYNKRYVIRAIEQGGINNDRQSTPINNTIIVGITTDSVVLKNRIGVRARKMFDGGVTQEAAEIAAMYGWDVLPLQAPIYQLSGQLLDNSITQEAAIEQFARSDWQLVRKQLTWFKRNEHITWLTCERVAPYLRQILVQA